MGNSAGQCVVRAKTFARPKMEDGHDHENEERQRKETPARTGKKQLPFLFAEVLYIASRRAQAKRKIDATPGDVTYVGRSTGLFVQFFFSRGGVAAVCPLRVVLGLPSGKKSRVFYIDSPPLLLLRPGGLWRLSPLAGSWKPHIPGPRPRPGKKQKQQNRQRKNRGGVLFLTSAIPVSTSLVELHPAHLALVDLNLPMATASRYQSCPFSFPISGRSTW